MVFYLYRLSSLESSIYLFHWRGKTYIVIFNSLFLAEFFCHSSNRNDIISRSLRKEMMLNLLIQTTKNMMNNWSTKDISWSTSLEIKPRIFLHLCSINNFHSDMIYHKNICQMYPHKNIYHSYNSYHTKESILNKKSKRKQEEWKKTYG